MFGTSLYIYDRLLAYGSVSICGIGKSGFVSSGRTTTQNSRMVRRGYDRHLHGQRLVPPKVRRRRSRRRLTDPLSTIILKDAPYCRANLKELSPSVTLASLCVPLARARPQILPYTRKGCVGEVPRCCFGKSSSALLEIHRSAP